MSVVGKNLFAGDSNTFAFCHSYSDPPSGGESWELFCLRLVYLFSPVDREQHWIKMDLYKCYLEGPTDNTKECWILMDLNGQFSIHNNVEANKIEVKAIIFSIFRYAPRHELQIITENLTAVKSKN